MRNVALFASQLGGREFAKYWPGEQRETGNIVLSDEMKRAIMEAHKIKM